MSDNAQRKTQAKLGAQIARYSQVLCDPKASRSKSERAKQQLSSIFARLNTEVDRDSVRLYDERKPLTGAKGERIANTILDYRQFAVLLEATKPSMVPRVSTPNDPKDPMFPTVAHGTARKYVRFIEQLDCKKTASKYPRLVPALDAAREAINRFLEETEKLPDWQKLEELQRKFAAALKAQNPEAEFLLKQLEVWRNQPTANLNHVEVFWYQANERINDLERWFEHERQSKDQGKSIHSRAELYLERNNFIIRECQDIWQNYSTWTDNKIATEIRSRMDTVVAERLKPFENNKKQYACEKQRWKKMGFQADVKTIIPIMKAHQKLTT